MALAEHVNVARRFQRAIRIDLDLGDPGAPRGVHLPTVISRGAEDYGTSHCRGRARGIHLDRTLRWRQVKLGGGAQRTIERQSLAKTVYRVDPLDQERTRHQ